MNKYISALAPKIEAMLSHRESRGLSRFPCAYQLKQFDRFCATHHSTLLYLNKEVVMAWLRSESMHQNNGLQKKVVAIRQFGKFLQSIGEDAYIVPDKFFQSKSSFSPYIFSDAELKTFFDVVDTLDPTRKYAFEPIVVPVLFRLLYTCGLRPGEGRELKRADVNLTTGEILIRYNKQKTERIVVMSSDMLELCRQYDVKRSILARDNRYFFPAFENQPYPRWRLDHVFRKCWLQANVNMRVSNPPRARPYDLRHRFATTILHKWLDEGRDLYAMLPYLRAFMGHATFSSTAYYIHLLPENLVRSAGIDWASFEKMFPEVEK